jgi:protein dithiol:quinone oxidoreductase
LKPASGRLLLAAAVLSLAAVGAALVSQHVFDMQPCPWCVLQRVIFVAIALVALPAGLLRLGWLRRIGGGAMLLLSLCGMAAALWQHFVAASSTSCNLTVADRIVGGLGLDGLWPEVFAAYATCADAAVKIAGVPYEVFSLVLFGALAVLGLQVLRRPR